jgi:hypothetical protein
LGRCARDSRPEEEDGDIAPWALPVSDGREVEKVSVWDWLAGPWAVSGSGWNGSLFSIF